jgi:hypothetical protein
MSKLETMPLKNITPDIKILKTLTKHDITKLSDFVDQVTPEGKILSIILPEAVNASKFFKFPDDENYFILYESLPVPHAKHLKQCPLQETPMNFQRNHPSSLQVFPTSQS